MTGFRLLSAAPMNEGSGRSRRLNVALGLVTILVLLAPLAAHAYLGSYSRYIADDFCTAGFMQRDGFWGSQAVWYQTWSGRFAFTFLINITHLAGSRLTPWLPALAVSGWAAVLIAFFRPWNGTGLRRWSWLPLTILAGLVLSLAFRGAPNIYQSLYWQTGLLTYSLPLILGTAYLAWLHRRIARAEHGAPVGVVAALLSAAITFIAGGFSETYVSVQTGALAAGFLGAIGVFRGPRRGGAIRLLAAGLLGSLLALAVIVIAPGNDVRRSLMAPPPELWVLLRRTVYDAYIYIYQVAKYQTIPLIGALAGPFLLAFISGGSPDEASGNSPRRWRLPVLAIPPVTAWMVTIPFAPSEYAISSYPDDRVLITQQYVLFLGLVLWAWCVGRWAIAALRSRAARVAPMATALFLPVLALLFWLAAASVQKTAEELPVYREYVAFWDRRDRVLREAALDSPGTQAVASLRHMGGLAEIGDDPDEWVNHCIAITYDVDAVVAK